MTDRLTLTAGFRYEQLDFDLVTSGEIFAVPQVPIAPAQPFGDLTLDGDKSQTTFIPKLAVNYKVAKEQRIGFTYSEGYRPGGVDLDIFGAAASGNGEDAVTEYDSEYVHNYEFSYKGLFLDGRLSVNSNLFYLDWEDMQTSGSANIRSGTFNAGESTVYGAEFETRWFASNESEVYFNVGYSKSNFDEFVTGGGVANGGSDFTDNEFANSPNLTAGIGTFVNIASWTLGVEGSYSDSYYDDITNTFEVESLSIVDLSATWTEGDLSVRLYANNIFDKVVQMRQTYDVQDSPFVEAQSLGQLSSPRIYGARVTYSF